MGLGAKLNFAFITVILVMVLSHAGYTLATDYWNSKTTNEKKLSVALQEVTKDFNQIAENNQMAAVALAQDPAVLGACAAHNRDQLAKVLKEFIARTGLAAFITVIDEKGAVFYSTETPGKFGYTGVRSASTGVDHVFMRSDAYKGAAAFSPTGAVTISSMVPLSMGAAGAGVMTVNQPISGEFLAGLTTKLALEPDHHLQDVDFALVSARDGKVIAVTPGLVNSDGGFVAKVNKGGLKAIPDKVFEEGGRTWQPFPLEQGKENKVGVLLLSAPMPNFVPKIINAAVQAAVAGGVGLVLALFFSAGISSSVQRPLRFLIQRARDLTSGRANLAPLGGLSGEWLELGELMDTSVASMRSSVQSLKQQLSRHNMDVDEKVRQAEAAGSQLETVNRQLAEKTRALAEVSKQVNFANQQIVSLQQKLDSVLQISTEGYLILDQFGNVMTANPIFLSWMGVSEGEIAGQLCFDLVKRPGEAKNSSQSGQVFSRHSGNPADLITQFYPEGVVHHRYQEKSVEVLAHLQPVVTDDSNIQGYIMVLRDKSLRSEIAQLKSELVATLRDSIRAPLATVEPTWKKILETAGQTMHPSVGQSLAEIHTHYEQLIGLIDSLLMIYGGVMPPPAAMREQVVITRLIADCLEEVAGSAREHQLMLDYKTVTGLPPVNVDADTLRRIIIQLLEKMIEITAAGGRVRVETLVKGNEMRTAVYSSGPALPQEEIEDMFMGFVEGKHAQETYGSRLSMYLARNSVERMGGRIWAESEQGRGTAIFFTISIR